MVLQRGNDGIYLAWFEKDFRQSLDILLTRTSTSRSLNVLRHVNEMLSLCFVIPSWKDYIIAEVKNIKHTELRRVSVI